MLEMNDQRKQKASWKLTIGRCLVSLLSVFLTQFSLSTVPRFFPPSSSLLSFISLSVVVLVTVAGLGRCCKGLLGVRASAPAFVLFSMLFIWGFYFAVIRQAISPLMDIVVNAELVVLGIGLYRILASDPGFVSYGSSCRDEHVNSALSDDVEATSEISVLVRRARYCKHCNAYVKGFDHHCPAFGNCIGEENHVLFIILLVGFIITEASYVACTYQFTVQTNILETTHWETGLSGNLVISTMIFCLLQVLWQVVFLAWHLYCVCFNIKTDEWINWKRYPEFQLVIQSHPGQTFTETRFRNPYDKGVLLNIKELFAAKQ